jgi:hypothetical protein
MLKSKCFLQKLVQTDAVCANITEYIFYNSLSMIPLLCSRGK